MATYSSGDNTKQQILTAFGQSFYEKGYAETTYEDIHQKTGIFPGAIHYHFKTKAEICLQIQTNYVDRIKLECMEYCKDDMYILTFLKDFIFFYKLFEDEHIRDFVLVANSLQTNVNSYIEAATRSNPLLGIKSKKDAVDEITFASLFGADMGMINYVIQEFDKVSQKNTYQTVARRNLKLICSAAYVSDKKFEEFYSKTKDILENEFDFSKLSFCLYAPIPEDDIQKI